MVISDSEIANPVVDEATVLVLMNQLSYDRFAERLSGDGLMLLNSSMVKTDGAGGGRTVAIAASQLAGEIGNVRVANMVLMGALNHFKQIMSEKTFLEVMQEMLGTDASKAKLFDLNKAAFRLGAERARKLD